MLAAAGSFSSRPRQREDGARPVPILLYHRIGAVADRRYAELDVRPADFAAQMRWLAKHGYRAVTLRQVDASWRGTNSLPRRPIVISFDDGYRSVYARAFPVLRARRWPGVLCLTVQQLPSELSPRIVRALVAAGWEIDAHTFTHPDLTRLGRARLEHEVAGARAVIRRRFGVPAEFFCYPYGRYNRSVVKAVRKAGYVAAATTDFGVAVLRERFALKRIGIERGDGVSEMVEKLEGAFAEFRVRSSRLQRR